MTLIYRSVYNFRVGNNTNSKDTILECALRLFGERGYEAVGITEITRSAGITKPTLYYFFQSKEGVFKAILEKYYERFNRLLQSGCSYVPHPEFYEEDIFPVLQKLVKIYFSFARDNTTFYLMLLSLSFAPPTAKTTIIAKPYFVRQYEIITALFHDFSDIHSNLKGKELESAYHFIALINANIGFWYQGITGLDEERAERIVHQFMHGIFS